MNVCYLHIQLDCTMSLPYTSVHEKFSLEELLIVTKKINGNGVNINVNIMSETFLCSARMERESYVLCNTDMRRGYYMYNLSQIIILYICSQFTDYNNYSPCVFAK